MSGYTVSQLFIVSTSTINRVEAAIKRHDYPGYVTRLVNYLPHSEVKTSRVWIANPGPRKYWIFGAFGAFGVAQVN